MTKITPHRVLFLVSMDSQRSKKFDGSHFWALGCLQTASGWLESIRAIMALPSSNVIPEPVQNRVNGKSRKLGGNNFLSCSGFSISPTGTIPRALGMICRCLISIFDASKWRGTGGKLSHPGRESFPTGSYALKLQRLGHIMRDFSIDSCSSINKKIASFLRESFAEGENRTHDHPVTGQTL